MTQNTVTLKAKLTNGDGKQVIEGLWGFIGFDESHTQTFKMTRSVTSTEEHGSLPEGKQSFDGWFKFDRETIVEKGIILAFEKEAGKTDEIFAIHGRGQNEFGTFKITGEAKKEKADSLTYTIKMRKDYIISIGTPVVKYFSVDGGPPIAFRGKVESFDVEKEEYTVRYVDDGKEELKEDEVIEIALRAKKSKSRKKKNPQPCKPKKKSNAPRKDLSTKSSFEEPRNKNNPLPRKPKSKSNAPRKDFSTDSRFEELKSEVNSLSKKFRDSEARHSEQEKGLVDMQGDFNNAVDTLKESMGMGGDNKRRITKLEKSGVSMMDKFRTQRKVTNAKLAAVKDMQRKFKGLEKEVQKMKTQGKERNARVDEKIGTITSELEETKGALQDLRQRNADLEAKNAKLTSKYDHIQHEMKAASFAAATLHQDDLPFEFKLGAVEDDVFDFNSGTGAIKRSSLDTLATASLRFSSHKRSKKN